MWRGGRANGAARQSAHLLTQVNTITHSTPTHPYPSASANSCLSSATASESGPSSPCRSSTDRRAMADRMPAQPQGRAGHGRCWRGAGSGVGQVRAWGRCGRGACWRGAGAGVGRCAAARPGQALGLGPAPPQPGGPCRPGLQLRALALVHSQMLMEHCEGVQLQACADWAHAPFPAFPAPCIPPPNTRTLHCRRRHPQARQLLLNVRPGQLVDLRAGRGQCSH